MEVAICSMRKKTEFTARIHHIHEQEMIFWLVFEMRSNSSSILSPHQYTCLRNARTIETQVFDDDKFIFSSEIGVNVFCRNVRIEK